MSIHIMGSVAFDRILSYKGDINDLLLKDKFNTLSILMLIDRIEEKQGGTAANIAYNLAMLQEKPHIYTCVGYDFAASYKKKLQALQINLDGVRTLEKELTACCHAVADSKGNLINCFCPAAMNTPCDADRLNVAKAGDYGIVSPGNAEDMGKFPKLFKEKGIPYIYDPGQQIPAVSKENHIAGIDGAEILIGNDYEIALISERTGLSKDELLIRANYVVSTLGEGGCLISQKGKADIAVPAPKIKGLVDPTGAGDSLRAGLLKGLTMGFDVETGIKMGSVCSAFCIEKYGTQEHSFDIESYRARYQENYGPCPL